MNAAHRGFLRDDDDDDDSTNTASETSTLIHATEVALPEPPTLPTHSSATSIALANRLAAESEEDKATVTEQSSACAVSGEGDVPSTSSSALINTDTKLSVTKWHAAAPSLPTPHISAKAGSQDDSVSVPMIPLADDDDDGDNDDDDTNDEDVDAEGRGRKQPEKRRRPERHDRTLPTADGVSTRRSKSRQQLLQQVGVKHEGRGDPVAETKATKTERRSSASSSSNGNEEEYSAEASNTTTVATAPQAPLHDFTSSVPFSTTQPNSPESFAATGARAKHDDAMEAATRAAITAQERQLRHTLLSIFPAHLRAMDATVHTPTWSSTPSLPSPASQRCSPEPLLPLLHALCEDKAYVYAAWCRYADDMAVRRTQNSIQRKRQRHSFSKGTRRTHAPSAPPAASSSGKEGGVEADNNDSDSGDETSEEESNQPPESEWVEAAPALTGPPHVAGSDPTSVQDGEVVVASGFQWTPWRFYREKRRRSTRRSQGSAAAASASAVAATAPHTSTTTTAGDVHAVSSSAGAAGAPTTTSSAPSASVVAVAPAAGGGVPPLSFSEVPSLPVLQVDADVPEDAMAPVEAMTAEEQKNYARYVMSSGKLRNVCRDPYSFLVSRAKELRLQWERQHRFE